MMALGGKAQLGSRPLLKVLGGALGGSEVNRGDNSQSPSTSSPYTKLTDVLLRCRGGLIAVGAVQHGD